jgi:hypothetical protein
VPLKKEIIRQILHGLGGLVAVLIIYSFYHSGRITPEATGLVVLLILALTTYLDGIRLGWHFSFAGFFSGDGGIFGLRCRIYVANFNGRDRDYCVQLLLGI